MVKNKGVLLILCSAVMFGSYGVWSKLLGGSFAPLFQGWTRGLILSIVLLPILLVRKELVPIARKDMKWLVVFLIFTSLTQAPIYYAFNHMDIGSATLIFFTSMLLTMYLVGIFFLDEKLSKIKILSFVLAAVGLYIIFSFSIIKFSLLAAVFAVLNGVASGGEVSYSKKLSRYSALYLSWLSWTIIFITNAPLSIVMGEVQHIPTFNIFWLYQLGYTLVSVLGFWFIIQGLKSTESSIGGLIGLLEVVFSVAFGIIIFSESLTLRVIIGSLLILIAAAMPHIKDLAGKRA